MSLLKTTFSARSQCSVRRAPQPVVQVAPDAPVQSGRRAMLAAGLALLTLAPQQPAQAVVCALSETTEEEAACFARLTANEKVDAGTYSKAAERSAFNAAPGVPVSSLDDEYKRATVKLGEDMRKYATMDINDYKNRVPLIKSLKQEGVEWVSKYARGGSARSDSARRMYVAVDSLVGHLAANGYAPMPSPKLKQMLKSIDEADSFLAIGK